MTQAVIERRISLRGAALAAIKERGAELLVCGPAGTGKSYAALYKVHFMLMLTPGMRALAVRKTHKSLTATGLVTFREQVAKDAIAAGICKWYGGSGEKPAQYIYSNGSVLVVGGMDNADKVMSAEYDVAYVQEATELTPDDWEKISSRLRNGVTSFQQLIADCNPQQPSHWLKKRCDEGKTKMLYSRHEDNPRIFEARGLLTEYGAAYLQRLDALSGVRKERLRFGRWAAAEGIIYEDWRPEVHLSDRKVLPFAWDRIWSVDFGYTHPFVWQMWAVDPDGRLWLEKEIYRSQRLVEDHAKDILDVVTKRYVIDPQGKRISAASGTARLMPELRAEWKYPKPRAIVCDHDAEDRATLERHLGMGTVAATKTVSDGIQAVQTRLRPAGDGQPRLFVCRDSLVSRDEALAEVGHPLGFAQEIEGYVWELDPKGIIAKDKPRKEQDDSMDAARYAAAYFDLKGSPRLRFM